MKQNDFKNINIKRWGCYFLCLIKIAELERGQEYTEDEILDLYNKFIKNGFMASNCYIIYPEKILLMLTGKNWDILKTTKIQKGKYIIAHVKTIFNTHHFLLIDKNEIVLYDPERKTEGTKYIFIGYRVINEIKQKKNNC